MYINYFKRNEKQRVFNCAKRLKTTINITYVFVHINIVTVTYSLYFFTITHFLAHFKISKPFQVHTLFFFNFGIFASGSHDVFFFIFQMGKCRVSKCYMRTKLFRPKSTHQLDKWKHAINYTKKQGNLNKKTFYNHKIK